MDLKEKLFCVECDEEAPSLEGAPDGYNTPGYCEWCWGRQKFDYPVKFRSSQIAKLSAQMNRVLAQLKSLEQEVGDL